jgi:dTDP-4-amino-4,6-dideoxygalactose transaminase
MLKNHSVNNEGTDLAVNTNAISPLGMNDLRRHYASVSDRIDEALARVTRSGWYIMNREVEAFEKLFASYCDVPHCIGVGNGTDALELALRALGVCPGTEVITAANAGMYTSTAIMALGGRPNYVDVDPVGLLLDPQQLEARIGPKTRAIVVTHLYGELAQIETIVDIAGRFGVPVVEDCAQAHGAARAGRKAGSFGAVGCFSFYPTKNLGAIGDAGALITRDVELGGRLRCLRQYGWGQKYVVAVEGGRNSRLDELQAAVLSAKLGMLDVWNSRRREIATAYSCGIWHPGISVPPIRGEEYVAHLYVVQSSQRDSLQRHLSSRSIGTDIHFPIPDHWQTPFRQTGVELPLPITETAARCVLSLPCFPEMTGEEVQRVIDGCNSWQT